MSRGFKIELVLSLFVKGDGAEEFVEIGFEEDGISLENGGLVADFEDNEVAVKVFGIRDDTGVAVGGDVIVFTNGSGGHGKAGVLAIHFALEFFGDFVEALVANSDAESVDGIIGDGIDLDGIEVGVEIAV